MGHIRLSHTLFNCHFQLVKASAYWADDEEAWCWCEFDFCCFGFGLVWEQCRNERWGEGCRSYTGACNIDTVYYLLRREEKKHLHCTLGNNTPIFFLLTINHYQWVVKIKWRFPMAAGKEIHQKCVTGHKKTWEKQQKRTKHDRTEHTI